jgi:curved DNA-binding protein CbpA
MKTAYQQLGLSEEITDDSQIKQAYLEQVKKYPPDRDAAQFQKIRAAYDLIKNEKSRLNYALFHTNEADFNLLLEKALYTEKPPLMTATAFVNVLRSSLELEPLK